MCFITLRLFDGIVTLEGAYDVSSKIDTKYQATVASKYFILLIKIFVIPKLFYLHGNIIAFVTVYILQSTHSTNVIFL